MPGSTFLAGDRVDLRTVEPEDLDFLRDGTNHPAVRQFAGGDLPYNTGRYERERLDPLAEGEYLHLLVCVEDRPVGDVTLAPIDDRRGWANLGYWVHPDHRGQGHATEAARLVVDHGFRELRLHRISATIVATNEPSIRVVEKLGFVHEGTKREDAFHDGEYVDREVYALLREEWADGPARRR